MRLTPKVREILTTLQENRHLCIFINQDGKPSLLDQTIRWSTINGMMADGLLMFDRLDDTYDLSTLGATTDPDTDDLQETRTVPHPPNVTYHLGSGETNRIRRAALKSMGFTSSTLQAIADGKKRVIDA